MTDHAGTDPRPMPPTVDQVVEAVAWHRQCNIWCRDREHAEIIWLHVDPGVTMDEDEIAALCASHTRSVFGATYRWHRLALEARAPSDAERVVTEAQVERLAPGATLIASTRHPDNTAIPVGTIPAAYLVGFRSGIKFDVVRQLYETVHADIAARARAREEGS